MCLRILLLKIISIDLKPYPPYLDVYWGIAFTSETQVASPVTRMM
jgi:hypothetical protein